MTCAHVLGLIDAGPFADCPRAHLEAAWRHARQCAGCGPALEAAIALGTDLAALPQPQPPPDLAAAVLARIEQVDQASAAPAAAPVPEAGAASSPRDWSAWGTLAGLAAGLAVVLSMPPGGGTPIDITSVRVGGMDAGLISMPSTTSEALRLAAGLALYAAGLFTPLGGRRRP